MRIPRKFRGQTQSPGAKILAGSVTAHSAGEPGLIAAAITSKAQAIQDAERARNELAKTEAEAAKTVAAADGEAKAAVTRANGEAEANRIRQTSLTPQLLELRKIENQKALIERWNGQLPTVQTGNGGLLMELPKMQ